MAVPNVPFWLDAVVNETGQRWMDAAGAALRVGTPFWCDVLAGKSKYDFELLIGYNYASNIPWRGYSSGGGGGVYGAKYYDPPGYSLSNFYVSGQGNRFGRMDLSPNPNRSFTVRSQDGNSWLFYYRNGFYQCDGAVANDMFSYFQSKEGQRVGFFIS